MKKGEENLPQLKYNILPFYIQYEKLNKINISFTSFITMVNNCFIRISINII